MVIVLVVNKFIIYAFNTSYVRRIITNLTYYRVNRTNAYSTVLNDKLHKSYSVIVEIT